MSIQPIQLNIDNTKSSSLNKKREVKSYLDATGAITTEDRVKPLPPKGHLIKDNLLTGTKYFFKDIAYDFKAIKDGVKGTANDHQLGKLNDVGLKVGGVGIATYLASQTTNPKARLMEYIGLGTFLTSMSLFPKIAINTPAKMLHGYDIDKEYIDDQGRKKSVQQDSNYVPYDMYQGMYDDEDISKIGDKMGIPRDIKNRNDLIKEQMRKIATQNNTLWMLTAGFATPIITALLCYGIENYIVAPGLENGRNKEYNKLINNLKSKTSNMCVDPNKLKENSLSRKVSKMLEGYSDCLPKEEFDNLVRVMTEGLDANLAKAVKKDLETVLKTGYGQEIETYVINDEILNKILKNSKKVIKGCNNKEIQDAVIPTREELIGLIKKLNSEANFETGTVATWNDIKTIKVNLREVLQEKINKYEGAQKDHMMQQRNNVIDYIAKQLRSETALLIPSSESKIAPKEFIEAGLKEHKSKIVSYAKIIGEFKENQAALEKCLNFKFGYAEETILARYYDKFEKTLLKELNFSSRQLQKMRESREYTTELLNSKFTELCSNEEKLKSTITKLVDVISKMEEKLHYGNNESDILNLLNSIENNFNNTAKRVNSLGGFTETIDKLVKQDVSTLDLKVKTKQDLINFLDGVMPNPDILLKNGYHLPQHEKGGFVKEYAKSIGSSKKISIHSMLERYQGATSSFFRIIHTLDVYKRALDNKEFAPSLAGKDEELINIIKKMAKETLLGASASDHTQKLHTVNNPIYFNEFMEAVFGSIDNINTGIRQKGYASEATKDAFSKNKNLLDRWLIYITRIKNIAGNNPTDFTKFSHILNDMFKKYTSVSRSNVAMFNLIGQSPIDMIMGAANRKYNTQKWVKIVSGIATATLGVTLLSQFGFGKIRNPQNVQKQVENDTNK